AMVRNLLAAFAVRIDQLAWMAPETRARAKAKLTTLKVGVGYPDKWRDYSGLKVIRGDAFGNAQRAELFELHYNLAKLGAAVDRLVAQFDAYRPFPDIHVNGNQTLSENIADVAGLSVAYDAWRGTLKGKPAPRTAGLSGEQLFFLSFAQSWRQKIREPALRQ